MEAGVCPADEWVRGCPCDEVAWFPTPGSRGKVKHSQLCSKLEHQNDKGWPWVLQNSPAVGGSCHLSAGPQHS